MMGQRSGDSTQQTGKEQTNRALGRVETRFLKQLESGVAIKTVITAASAIDRLSSSISSHSSPYQTKLAEARRLEKAGKHREAGGLFEELGEFQSALDSYSKVPFCLGKLMGLEERLENDPPTYEYKIQKHERRGEFKEAAEHCLAAGMVKRAVENYEHAGMPAKAKEVRRNARESRKRFEELRAVGRFREAAEAAVSAGKVHQAIACYLKCYEPSDMEKAADLAWMNGKHQRAIGIYDQSRSHLSAAELAKKFKAIVLAIIELLKIEKFHEYEGTIMDGCHIQEALDLAEFHGYDIIAALIRTHYGKQLEEIEKRKATGVPAVEAAEPEKPPAKAPAPPKKVRKGADRVSGKDMNAIREIGRRVRERVDRELIAEIESNPRDMGDSSFGRIIETVEDRIDPDNAKQVGTLISSIRKENPLDKGIFHDSGTYRDRSEENIHSLVLNGDLDKLSHLLGQGEGIDEIDDKCRTPLHIAIENGRTNIVIFLVDNGANLETADNSGRTPLMVAVENNLPEIAKYLLAKGADVDTQDNDGNTPLMVAVTKQNLLLVKTLLESVPDVSIRNFNRSTVMDIAWEGRSEAIKDCIIKYSNSGGKTWNQRRRRKIF